MGLAYIPPITGSFGAPSGSFVAGGRCRVKYTDPTAAGVAGTGAAGTYTGSVTQPAGSQLLDIILYGVALWNSGTSATGIVGDVADPDGYYTGINLSATDLLATESISFALAGGKAGAYIAGSQANRRLAVADRLITFMATLVGTAATTGETWMDVIWGFPSRADATGIYAA